MRRRSWLGALGEGGVGTGALLGAAAVVGLIVWAIRKKKLTGEQVETISEEVAEKTEEVVAAVESATTETAVDTAVAAVEETSKVVDEAVVTASEEANKAVDDAKLAEDTGSPAAPEKRAKANKKVDNLRSLVGAKAKLDAVKDQKDALPPKQGAKKKHVSVRPDALRALEDTVYATAWKTAATKAGKVVNGDSKIMAIVPGSTEAALAVALDRSISALIANPPPPTRLRSGKFVDACEGGAAKRPIWNALKDLYRLRRDLQAVAVKGAREITRSNTAAPKSMVDAFTTLVKIGVANLQASRLAPVCNADIEKYAYDLKNVDVPAYALRGVDLTGQMRGRPYPGGGLMSLRALRDNLPN